MRGDLARRTALITLNRPKQLNALNDALMDQLGQALLEFDADAGIGCIVVTGSDKAFAAGADIAAMATKTYMQAHQGEFITRNWETMRRVRKPVIAAGSDTVCRPSIESPLVTSSTASASSGASAAAGRGR